MLHFWSLQNFIKEFILTVYMSQRLSDKSFPSPAKEKKGNIKPAANCLQILEQSGKLIEE